MSFKNFFTPPHLKEEKPDAQPMNPGLQFGLNFAGMFVGAALLGVWLQKKTGWEGWVLIGVALGFGAGGWELYKVLQWMNRPQPPGEEGDEEGDNANSDA